MSYSLSNSQISFYIHFPTTRHKNLNFFMQQSYSKKSSRLDRGLHINVLVLVENDRLIEQMGVSKKNSMIFLFRLQKKEIFFCLFKQKLSIPCLSSRWRKSFALRETEHNKFFHQKLFLLSEASCCGSRKRRSSSPCPRRSSSCRIWGTLASTSFFWKKTSICDAANCKSMRTVKYNLLIGIGVDALDSMHTV